jgi:hypothetical protein
MKITPLRTITARVPTSLADAVERVAFSKGMTISDFIRGALQEATELDLTTRRHAGLLHEVAKNRALFLHYLDTQLDPGEVEKMIDQAEQAATEYVAAKGEREDD